MEVKTCSVDYYLNEKKFCVESWYELLSKFTAKSYFIKLSIEDCEAIRSFYKVLMLKKKEEINEKTVKLIYSLELKIKDIIEKNKLKEFFVRFTMRSPKDAVPYDNEKIKFVLEKINKFEGSSSEKLRYLFVLQETFLKCSSVEDAMNLSLTSERVFSDLYRYISMEKNIGKLLFDQNIIIREWIDGLTSEKEFRCFVYKNKLVAISQYNHYITIPELIENEDYIKLIRNKIFGFWNNNIKGILIDFQNYVVDFALINEETVYLIELNPFDTKTGAGLFCWNYDKEVLLNEFVDKNKEKDEILIDYCSNIAFRCKTEENSNMKEMIEDLIIPELNINLNDPKYDSFYSKYGIKVFEKNKKCIIF